jgi:hypothetical protein
MAILHEADGRIVREVTSPQDRADQRGPGPALPQAVHIERRREHRYPANDIVEVHAVGSLGDRFPATIVDLSRSGLRLEVGKPLSRGTRLEIVLKNRAIIFGESCYARPKNGLYQVGVSIESVYFARTSASEHVDVTLLRDYGRGGSLATEQVLEVRNHLRDCEVCRGVVAAYEKMPLKERGKASWSQEHEKV